MTSCFWRDRYRKCAWLSLPLFPQTEAFTERGVPFVSTGQISANRSSSCRNSRGGYGHLPTEAAIVSQRGQASFRPFHTGAGPGAGTGTCPTLCEFQQKCLTTTSRPDRVATRRDSVQKRQRFDLASSFSYSLKTLSKICRRHKGQERVGSSTAVFRYPNRNPSRYCRWPSHHPHIDLISC